MRLKEGRPTKFERTLAATVKTVRRTKSLEPLYQLLNSVSNNVDKGNVYAQLALQHAIIFGDAAKSASLMAEARACWPDNYEELSDARLLCGLIRRVLDDPFYIQKLDACGFMPFPE